jgi:hypothetical protein
MREEQDEDDVVSRVQAWVAMGAKPSPEELDAESQETRALVSRWSELAIVEGVLVRLRQGSSQLWHGVFRHMHASPLSAGHMGRDQTYKRLRDKAWWSGYRSDVYEWIRWCVACQLAKPGPGRGRMPLVQERAGAPFERVALDLIGPLPPSRRGKVYR